MRILAKTQYKKGFWMEWQTDYLDDNQDSKNDINVILENDKGKYLADAICHWGSYGVEDGLWEVMVEHPPKSWGNSVKGHLTWKEVEKYFDREIKLTKPWKNLKQTQ